MREGWKHKKLGQILDIQNGYAFNSKQFSANGSMPLIRIRDLKAGNTTETCYEGEFDEKYIVRAGDLLVGMDGEFACHQWNGPNALLNQRVCRLEKFSSELMPRFLYYGINKYLKEIESLTTYATVKHLSARQIKAIKFPLPPVSEQKRIVAILDEAFAGIEKAVANTEKNLANARELFENTVIDRVFGDPDTKGWKESPVEKLARPEKGSIRTGPFGSQLLHSEFVDKGIAVLGIDNAVNNKFAWGRRRFITPEKYEDLKRYTVKPGDVLITIMGTCGRCAVVPENIPLSINSKHLCCISLDQEKCIPQFLHAYFLYHPVARLFLGSHAKGSIMSGLNMGIIKKLPVRLPSLKEQRAIVESIETLSNETLQLEMIYQQKRTALAELKQSLLQKAFSGELTASANSKLKEAAA
jgi:type I restriction enzyme S subunit